MDRCLTDDLLLDHADARLSGLEAVEASAHLETCSRCRSALTELVALRDDAARDRPLPGALAEARVFEAIRGAARVAPRRTRMSAPLRWAVAAVVLLVGSAGLIGVSLRSSKAGVVVAKVVSTDGRVVVRRGGVDRPAARGLDLHEGDRVTVPADATAVLDLSDQSRAELGAESSLIFHDPAGREPLEFQGGFLAVDAARRPADRPLTIRTPDARAEVLGTRFTLGADAAETHLRVAEGLVHLVRIDDGASVDVAAGNRAEVSDDDHAGLRSRPTLSGTVLMITSHDQAPADFARFSALVGDRLLGRRLRHLGFRVETIAHADVTARDLVDRPLVIVSYSAEGVGFEESLKRVGLETAKVPVLCFEPAAFPTLAMSGAIRGTDFDWQGSATGVVFAKPDHPLSGGLSGLRRDLFDFDKPGSVGWARPGRGAETIVAFEGDSSRAVMFAYEAGSEMVGKKAPRRRVGLFLDPSRVGEDSEPAWSLVEAAVEWCVEPPMGFTAGAAR